MVNNPQYKWIFLNDTLLAFIIVLLFDYIILFLAIDKLFFFHSLKPYFYNTKHRLNLELKWESVNIHLLVFYYISIFCLHKFIFSESVCNVLAHIKCIFNKTLRKTWRIIWLIAFRESVDIFLARWKSTFNKN